jgi:shikimate dehydrogenase
LLDERPSRLVIANRTVEKARGLCERFATAHADIALEAAGYAQLDAESFDVVVNATSAGLSGGMPALPPLVFSPGALAYDMVYGCVTPFLDFALRSGARASDGLGMLVEQAAESFFIWRGVRPHTAPVIAHLRA